RVAEGPTACPDCDRATPQGHGPPSWPGATTCWRSFGHGLRGSCLVESFLLRWQPLYRVSSGLTTAVLAAGAKAAWGVRAGCKATPGVPPSRFECKPMPDDRLGVECPAALGGVMVRAET